MLPAGAREQLVVTAYYSDGSTRNVTRLTNFASNEAAIVSVDAQGLVVAGSLPGEASIMARYMGNIGTWNTAIPLPTPVDAAIYAQLPRYNVVDGHVWDKLQQLNILPSEPADDSTFLRRVHLDITGRLPSVEESRQYLADANPDKRARLVEALLSRPEVRRLLGQQVGRSAAAESVSRWDQGDDQPRQLGCEKYSGITGPYDRFCPRASDPHREAPGETAP